MTVIQRLRAALRAALREWSRHSGEPGKMGADGSFVITGTHGKKIDDKGWTERIPLSTDGLAPPYVGEFLMELEGRRFALRHHVVSPEGVVRYFDEAPVEGYMYCDDYAREQSLKEFRARQKKRQDLRDRIASGMSLFGRR